MAISFSFQENEAFFTIHKFVTAGYFQKQEEEMIKTPSPSYSIIMRVELLTRPGMLEKVTSTIGKAGGDR